MNYIEIIDNRYGDNEVACNLRTADSIGKVYKGKRVIIDIAIGDFLVACNQRTFDSLVLLERPKEALQPEIIAKPIKDTPKEKKPVETKKKGKK